MKMQTAVRPFGMRDKVGYLFGDLANDFTFVFASTYVMVFYSKVMGIDTGTIGTMFLIARCVDAFTDVGMGRLVDRCSPAQDGKFRPWIRRMAGPVAVASFLMYQSFLRNASMNVRVAYMFITYLLWGSVFYTAINIPYGSMAAVLTDDQKHRSSLSVFRSMGSVFATIVISVIAPLAIYHADEAGNQVVSAGWFTAVAGLFSLLAILFYFLCYIMTTERVKVDPKQAAVSAPHPEELKKPGFWKSLFSLLTNLPFIGMILSSLVMMFATLMSQGVNNFLFADYFCNTRALSIFSLISIPAMLLLAVVSTPLCARFGKKEVGVVSCLLSGVLYALIGFARFQNVWVFIVASFIAMLGKQCFSMQTYALVTDVIDDIEVRTNTRSDGMVYGVYSFARKIGQAISGGMSGWALAWIGYDSAAVVQTEAVCNGLYGIANFFPAISFFLIALILAFLYPLDRRRVQANGKELNRRKAARS